MPQLQAIATDIRPISDRIIKIMRQISRTIPLAMAGFISLSGTARAEDADLILFNGNIITMDEARPRATALAIAGSMIAAIGDDTLINRYKTNSPRLIDLKGKTVIPGLVDTHIHAIRGGQTYSFETYWYDKTKLSDALQALQNAAAEKPQNEWVAVVGSWLPEQFDKNVRRQLLNYPQLPPIIRSTSSICMTMH